MAIAPAAINAAALALVRKSTAHSPLSPSDLKQVAKARKAAIAADASRARASPAFQASDRRKTQARAKLQQLREWLTVVKKLYAQNPQGMARALAQAFKDLKAAVAAYKDAGGEEMAAAGGAVAATITATAQGAKATDDDPADGEASSDPETGSADAGSQPPGPETQANPLAAPLEGHARYDAAVGEVRKMIGEEGLDFLKEVRGMVDELRKLLEAARGQAAIRKRDKDTDTAFEDADKALKDLGEAMSQMERQIRTDAPSAGMTLSVAA